MILSLRRTGGFAGIQDSLGTMDTAVLSGEAQHSLAAQLRELERLAAMPPSPAADQFRYEVDIREATQPPRTLVILDEGDATQPAQRALVALMETLGLPVP
jgi:hypothetical protein